MAVRSVCSSTACTREASVRSFQRGAYAHSVQAAAASEGKHPSLIAGALFVSSAPVMNARSSGRKRPALTDPSTSSVGQLWAQQMRLSSREMELFHHPRPLFLLPQSSTRPESLCLLLTRGAQLSRPLSRAARKAGVKAKAAPARDPNEETKLTAKVLHELLQRTYKVLKRRV